MNANKNVRVITLPSPDTDGSAGTPARSDALHDRVNAWVSLALTKAKVKPVPDTDKFTATLPPFRKFCGLSESESAALDDLRDKLIEHARTELCAGRELPTWESRTPEITPESKRLVRLSNLKHELRTRAALWGAERQLLPAGAVERCLADIDALVTRHAMQIQGVTPPVSKSPSLPVSQSPSPLVPTLNTKTGAE